MITREQLIAQPHQLRFKLLLNGGYGHGKTYVAATFPKFAYAQIEPHGLMTVRTHPTLLHNLVYFEDFVPSDSEDIKVTFQRLSAFLKQCRKDAEAGVIETVIVDNLTHLMENRWLYIQKYERQVGRSGQEDTRSMYGTLSRWAYRTVIMELVSIPAHVVLTAHTMEEEEEDVQSGKLLKTGQLLTNTLGSFRDKVAGLFNASIFLEVKRLGVDKYQYLARCLPSNGKPAKNNLGLPEVVENISYQTLLNALPMLDTVVTASNTEVSHGRGI